MMGYFRNDCKDRIIFIKTKNSMIEHDFKIKMISTSNHFNDVNP